MLFIRLVFILPSWSRHSVTSSVLHEVYRMQIPKDNVFTCFREDNNDDDNDDDDDAGDEHDDDDDGVNIPD